LTRLEFLAGVDRSSTGNSDRFTFYNWQLPAIQLFKNRDSDLYFLVEQLPETKPKHGSKEENNGKEGSPCKESRSEKDHHQEGHLNYLHPNPKVVYIMKARSNKTSDTDGMISMEKKKRYRVGNFFWYCGIKWEKVKGGFKCGTCKGLISNLKSGHRTRILQSHVDSKKCCDVDRSLSLDSERLRVHPGGNVIMSRGIIDKELLASAFTESKNLKYEAINLRGEQPEMYNVTLTVTQILILIILTLTVTLTLTLRWIERR